MLLTIEADIENVNFDLIQEKNIMLMKFNRYFYNCKKILQDPKGFSMIEVLGAIAITMLLASTLTLVVASTTQMLAEVEQQSLQGLKNQQVLSDFTTNSREAINIVSATTTELKYTVRAQNTCELHHYQFLADPSNSGQMLLNRKITAVSIAAGIPCSSVEGPLISGTIAPQTNRVEINNLNSGSKFAFYSKTGQKALVSGDVGYDSAKAPVLCQLGSVAMTLDTKVTNRNKTKNSVEVVRAAFRNNTRGLSC